MLTGRRAFEDEDVSMTLSKVLQREPDFDALPESVPARVRQTLRLCLRKDQKQRMGDVRDVRLALEGAFETAGTQTAAPVATRLQVWQRPVPAAIAVLLVTVVSSLAVWGLTRLALPTPGAIARFPIPLVAGEVLSGLNRRVVAVSPDGSHVVYSANEGLSLRPLAQLQATPMPGTDGARGPFFSPDGEWIGFWATDRLLKKVSVAGGAPVILGEATINPLGASWGEDDSILFSQGPAGIWQVPGTGGTPEVLIPVEEGELTHGPQMLPGGEWVLFTLLPSGVSSWDQAHIVVQSLETGERLVLIEGGRDARYVSTGHLVYGVNGGLVRLIKPFIPTGEEESTEAALARPGRSAEDERDPHAATLIGTLWGYPWVC